jgi:hypothetical protein
VFADKPGSEPGVEYSCMDIAGDSFLVGKQHLVVYRGVGILGYQGVAWYVADGLGFRLRKSERSAKGE